MHYNGNQKKHLLLLTKPSSPYRYYLLIPLLITLSGCSGLNQYWMNHKRCAELKAGETAFLNGNYMKAQSVFTSIAKNSESTRTKNIALFNLACTRLVASKQDSDYRPPLKLLKAWKPPGKIRTDIENPRFAVLSLQKTAEALNQERIKNVEKEETIQNQKQRIRALEKQIKTLQYQISELENIDHDIQEKRNTK